MSPEWTWTSVTRRVAKEIMYLGAAMTVVLVIGSLYFFFRYDELFVFPYSFVASSSIRLTDSMFYATPLILCGLAVAIPGQTKLLNIGGEGQLYVGAFLTGVIGCGFGIQSPLPWWLLGLMLRTRS